jgi:hypothetical protein
MKRTLFIFVFASLVGFTIHAGMFGMGGKFGVNNAIAACPR